MEGMALAQGTLSTFAFLRQLTPEPAMFRSAISKLLGLGGLGTIAGPTVGYVLLGYGPERVILAMAGLSLLFFLVQISFFRSTGRAVLVSEANQDKPGSVLWFVIGLTAAKALGVGWEPNLAWWAQSNLHLSANVAGISFLILGLAFVIGSLKPIPKLLLFSFVGLAALEFSLHGTVWAWWPALGCLGLWYGIFVTLAVGRLGWDNPEKIGRHNSFWMLGTDLPMTFVPAILWVWRSQDFALQRISLALVLLLISSFSLWRGLAQDSRAPTGNYPA